MSDVAPERRRNIRPLPISPALRLKIDVVVRPIVNGLVEPYRGMVLLLLLITCCFLWVIWCVEVRMAPIHLNYDSVTQEARLRNNVQTLQAKYDEPKRAAIHGRLTEEFARILDDYQALASWLHERAELARLAGLRFEYKILGPVADSEIDGVVRVPLTLEIKVNVQSAANNGYARLLDQLYAIEQDPALKELRLAEMETQNNKVGLLRVEYAIWMLEDDENLPAARESDNPDIAPQTTGLEVVSS